MTADPQAELNDDTLRAIGQYVVSFGGLMHCLEWATGYMVAPVGAHSRMVDALLADRTGKSVIDTYIAVFAIRWDGQMTPEDKAILKRLHRELLETLNTRNRMMHDAWLAKTVGGEPGPFPLSRSRFKTSGEGASYDLIDLMPDDIRKYAVILERLERVVNRAVFYERPGMIGPELDNRIEIADEGIRFKEIAPAG